MTKAVTGDGNQLEHGAQWIAARRASLRVFEDRLECGDWVIPYDEVNDAVLTSVTQMFIPGYVLGVTTGDKSYHFGLNPGSYWKGDLPFPVRREKGKLTYSTSSVVLRIVVIAGAVMLWLWFSRGS